MVRGEQVIVAGSGLAAAAAARALAAAGLAVTLVEEREPVNAGPVVDSVWYSGWWPGGDEALSRLAADGIDRLEALQRESGAAFSGNRRGQLFVTARPELGAALQSAAGRHASQGFGPLREHATTDWYLPSPPTGFRGVPDGLDLLADAPLRAAFPFLGPAACLGVHVRRAGWVDARALRRWLLGTTRSDGGSIVPDTITEIGPGTERVWAVRLGSGATIAADALVLAGERAPQLARRAGVPGPWLEGHRISGSLAGGGRILPPMAPMIVDLDATPTLADRHPAAELPPAAGLAIPSLLATFRGDLRIDTATAGPVRPDEVMRLGETVVERLGRLVPDLITKRGPPGQLSLTSRPLALPPDLRPVVGLADRRGGYLMAGLGGNLAMILAAADLLATYLTGASLPTHAPSFAPARPDPAPIRPTFRAG
ncbi:MAG: FAD-dependent oxidoreductase [Gemmatimonadales bacterium]|nr:FAD-dependent oxidoreductase [Gemmatimonadales bacterium]